MSQSQTPTDRRQTSMRHQQVETNAREMEDDAIDRRLRSFFDELGYPHLPRQEIVDRVRRSLAVDLSLGIHRDEFEAIVRAHGFGDGL